MSLARRLWLTAKTIANYVLLTGTFACFSSVFSAAHAASTCLEPQPLTHAQRVVTQNDHVLDDSLVSLPDQLPRAWRNEQVRIRYSLDVSECSSRVGSGLWLFRVGAPFTISANGQPLVSLLTSEPLLERLGLFAPTAQPIFNGRIPVLFALPAGTERVDITLQTLPYIGAGLTHIQVGATNLLMPIANEGLAHIVGYANAAAGVLLLLALMLLFLWLSRRQDLGLLWMSVACALWSVRALAYYDSSVDMPALWFEQLNPLNIMLTAAALAAATVWTWAGNHNPRVWRALLAMSALSAGALVVSTALGQGALAARALTQLMAFITVLWTIGWVWRRKDHIALRHWGALLLGYAAMMGCALHDIMLVTGPIAPTGPSYLFWGFSVLLVMFAIITGEYIVNSLGLAERSNEELARRVDEKTLALSHSYGQLRDAAVAAARDTARTQERERLLRDMHDGMGAQLMTALRGVERGTLSSTQVAQSLQDGLDELRLLMDSTDNTQPLQSALANWRNRWDSRLDATGLTLHWQIDDALEGLNLPGDTVLQVMRVLQEAATNIVKHARATQASVSATVVANPQGGRELVLEIADNGVGLNQEGQKPGRGRGIDNMRHRAQQIGATLALENVVDGLPGAVVRLRLALDQTNPTNPRRAASTAASARDEMPSLR